MTLRDEKHVRRWVREHVAERYGSGLKSAWAHMSAEQREDALVAAAGRLILSQAESVSLDLAAAQGIVRAAISEANAR